MAESSARGLGQKAYQALVEAIEDGSLTPSSRIVEVELAAQLNMSRTPVREAVQRLEAEGLLVHEPRKGLTVSRLTQERVVELYDMREVLEGAAAAFAAQHASNAEIEVLQQLCRHEHEVIGDPVMGARHNRYFHQNIFRSAHNSYLLRNLSTLTSSMALLGNYTRHIEGRAEKTALEHLAIVEAIASRNPVLAEQKARAHIRSAHEARLKDMSGF
ncbi:MAG: GntR family transcriptional regulator [Caballeronia sp.]|jgi:DNA-binding GntR family transcriptional regulator|uniref:GntR family transcriptional regulator n=1 Tax=Caballeronia sp. TaxID=1931223 RepID=UPI00262707FE|nr:GntR family transcriptional regulator [Caballeronia sp.]MDB5831297.1 GntR family transcriptional regulator [Caballeronia sp.]